MQGHDIDRRLAMYACPETELPTDAILCADDLDAPIAVWTIEELDHLSDLDSVRTAWMRTDGVGC